MVIPEFYEFQPKWWWEIDNNNSAGGALLGLLASGKRTGKNNLENPVDPVRKNCLFKIESIHVIKMIYKEWIQLYLNNMDRINRIVRIYLPLSGRERQNIIACGKMFLMNVLNNIWLFRNFMSFSESDDWSIVKKQS